ncbi:MAG: copper amine oxidase N-terminal domain-containing protein [Oscillospiraceae bacterium]|nr:copper amine oxidase N-terminal domain-containing protein [Oscillospiraceae bacterium]
MKKFLNAKISVKSILALALVVSFIPLAVAAAPVIVNINAVMRPDFTIKLDNEVQSLNDSMGNPTAPIVYNGTTFVPLKAISKLLGCEVTWDGSTDTVSIFSPGFTIRDGVSLVNNSEWDRTLWWSSMDGVAGIPQPKDDFGNEMNVYSQALRVRDINSAIKANTLMLNVTGTKVSFDGVYFTRGNDTAGAMLTIRNGSRDGVILYEADIPDGFSGGFAFDLKGATALSFEAKGVTVFTGDGSLYLMNPVIQ